MFMPYVLVVDEVPCMTASLSVVVCCGFSHCAEALVASEATERVRGGALAEAEAVAVAGPTNCAAALTPAAEGGGGNVIPCCAACESATESSMAWWRVLAAGTGCSTRWPCSFFTSRPPMGRCSISLTTAAEESSMDWSKTGTSETAVTGSRRGTTAPGAV
jgi:hypothetical protein